MKRTLINDNEYAAEAAKHIEWLNWIFGITTFLFAVSALQFRSPWKVCVLGLFLIVPMYVYAFRSFPPSLVALRQLAKAEPHNAELQQLKTRLERRFHGWQAFLRLTPFWIAFTFYLLVMATGVKGFSFLVPVLAWVQA